LKLESCNPGGSIKEKNAVYLIRRAIETGHLRPGGTIIESSSGNFGIGLAMVGAALGYKVVIVVDPKTPPPLRRMLLAYGARLVDVPASQADEFGSLQGARMKKAEALAGKISGGWYVCQHLNPDNPTAHYEYTAREIEAAFKVLPDVIVAGVSTAGQITGLTRYFAKRHPQVKFVAVDVAGSAILGTPRHPYKMTGLGLCFTPPVFNPGALTAAYSVTDQIAFSMCHLMARKEGLLLGASTGAIVAAGLAVAGKKPKKILMINPDRGDRYLETVYNHKWLKAQNIELLGEKTLLKIALSLKPVPRNLLLRNSA
jgi:cysteine synthase A